jgi:hypothetical protein
MEISGRAARRHVEIFNFSFLDILACVIGLLIFILTIVVISGGIGATSASRDQTAALTASEHELQQARTRGEIAQRRRRNAESLLRTTSSDVSDVTLARETVEAQIRQFTAEQAEIHAANNDVAAGIASTRRQLEGTPADPSLVERIDQMTAETAALDADTARIDKKLAGMDAAPLVARKEVSFEIPRVRSSSKTPIFIEVQGQRMWFVHSDDYDQAPDPPGTVYTRRQRAPGMLISALVANKQPVPAAIAGLPLDGVVLTFVVRPDGYDAFREIREWAWKKGYSVHWIPLSSESKIELVPAEHSWEQGG